MQTKPKANSVITHEFKEGMIVFRVKGAGELILDPASLAPEVRERAMIHGLIQRVSDAAALSRDTATGLPATPQDKLAAMTRLVDHYNAGGPWAIARAGGGNEGGFLLRVLIAAYPSVDPEKLRERIKGWKPAERAAVLNEPRIKEIADRLKSEATAGVDTGSLLEGLEEA